MDRRERISSLHDALIAALSGWQAGIWTALPAVVQSFDAAAMTIVAQPTIQAKVLNQKGIWEDKDMPLLLDVPVCFPTGGGFTMTFPIAAGDEVLIVFSSRCIDTWWQLGGTQNVQAEWRMHDLSDGFAIIGPRSQPRKISGISTNSVQIRKDDGAVFIELASGQINIKGDVHVTGAVIATGEGTFNNHTVGQHIHSDPQGGNTGLPTG